MAYIDLAQGAMGLFLNSIPRPHAMTGVKGRLIISDFGDPHI